MSTVSILQKDASVLRKKAKSVPEKLFGTTTLAKMLSQMTEALDAEQDGVALAAPQIGLSYRIFIVRYDRLLPPKPAASDRAGSGEPAPRVVAPDIGVYINPEFVRRARRKRQMDEGCLSVRGLYGKTKRHERATVRAKDENGKMFERGGGGILAQVFQHETDHLNGVLFIDHATDLVELPPVEKAGGPQYERPKR